MKELTLPIGYMAGLCIWLLYLKIKEIYIRNKERQKHKAAVDDNLKMNFHTCPSCLSPIKIKRNKENEIIDGSYIETIQRCMVCGVDSVSTLNMEGNVTR
ncbi:hypothetical protein [Brevibacillus brevis]|uniref:hypothetical protein n=1 Tax=Brevibacillus brevis TaxID=1393 RepID=UPI0007D8ACC1|nr:hypothetical protein [Brevibacillus brevis]